MTWTQERVERLKELKDSGWSAGRIAADLGGVTRNAVIGKVRRLGLPSQATTVALPRLSKNPNMARTHCRKARPKPVRKPVENAPKPLHLTLTDLTKSTCKYPYGDSDFTFCGHESAEGSSWCPYHKGVVFNVQ